MAKFPEAAGRLFRGVYVCKKCKTKIKAQPLKILQKRIACRRCQCKAFRPIKSKK